MTLLYLLSLPASAAGPNGSTASAVPSPESARLALNFSLHCSVPDALLSCRRAPGLHLEQLVRSATEDLNISSRGRLLETLIP